MISITPPTHERSRFREDIFLPVRLPRMIAAAPVKSVSSEVVRGAESESPQPIPVAAQSSELAAASAKASRTERDFELSVSAAVSSKYRRITRLNEPDLRMRSRSATRLISFRVMLLKMTEIPMKPMIKTLAFELFG